MTTVQEFTPISCTAGENSINKQKINSKLHSVSKSMPPDVDKRGLIFKNSFTCRFVRKFLMYTSSQKCPSHLQYVATLPCEIRKSKNVTEFSRDNV